MAEGALYGRAFIEILPDTRRFGSTLAASMRTARGQLNGTAAGFRAAAGTVGNSMAKVGKNVTLLGVGVGITAVKMAGDFQKETSVLQTAANETTGGLKKVRSGIMDISKGTGTGLKELSDGMYTVEKAGFHAANGGLLVLKAAAQGAKEENAKLSDVTNAMTSVMASYHLKATDSVRVMNGLKTAAGEGKITMEEFSGALSTVLPIASANKISFAQVGGAIATLTQHGTSAREATQELAGTIKRLAAPSNVASREMTRYGLSSVDVSTKIGKRGLTGTFDLLTSTILSKMGPSGKILLSAFEGSKQSATDARIMLDKMPPSIQKMAKQFQAGKITQEDWNKSLKSVPVGMRPMLTNFASLENKSRGFSRELKLGGPSAKTYTDSLGKMAGGAIGLNTILQLSGESADGFKERVKKTGESFNHASKNVEGWKQTQQLFNVQLDRAKQTVQVFAVQLGTRLIPVILSAVKWLSKHVIVVKALAFAIGGILAATVVAFIGKQVLFVAKMVTGFAKIGIAGVKMGANLVKGFASANAAAAQSTGRMGTLGGKMRTAFSAAGSGISSAFTTIRLKAMYAMDGIKAAASRGATAASSAFSTMRLKAMYAMDGIKKGVSTAAGAVKSFAKSVGSAATSAGKAAWGGIVSGVKAVGGAMSSAASAVGSFTKSLLTNISAGIKAAATWVAQKVAMIASTIATKAAAAGQWLLNLAMRANPIMLIVTVIMVLVGAIVFLATKTKFFQTIWHGLWIGMKAVAEWVWNGLKVVWAGIQAGFSWVWHAAQTAFGWIKNHWVLLGAILMGPIALTIYFVIHNWGRITAVISAGFKAIGSAASWLWKNGLKPTFSAIVAAFKAVGTAASWVWDKVLKPTFRFIVNAWLVVSSAILHGAAAAFGWMPGIGGKLKSAAKKFDTFKNDVNSALKGISGKKVTVPVVFHTSGGEKFQATGGPVYGPGTETSDDVPTWLSRGEHVLTAKEVRKAGGHGAVYRMRQALLHDQAPRFASGGPVGVNVVPSTPSYASIKASVSKTIHDVVAANAKKIFDSMVPDVGSVGGHGVTRWTGVVHQALSLLHQPIAYTATTLRRMNQESGGNPTIVNKWDCITLDAMISTQRGWLKHDDVRDSDQTIGYNPETGRSEWTRINRVVHYAQADTLVVVGDHDWSTRCTPNHRWLTAGGMIAAADLLSGTQIRISDDVFLTVEEIRSGDPEDVWCVTTDLGSWTARQDDHVFLTGNSNWKAGHPSVGLMQVIGPTFRSFAGFLRVMGPFLYGVSVNPLANVYASMRYALSRYGSLPRAYNRAGGYAKGGIAGSGKWITVGEQGPETISLGQTSRIYPNRGTGGPVTINVDLHNHGVIGSKRDAIKFLSEAFDQMRRTGQLPRALGGTA